MQRLKASGGTFGEGQVTVFDEEDGLYHQAKILELELSASRVRIHFVGWTSK